MKKTGLLFLVLFFSTAIFAQNRKIDSIIRLLPTFHDSVKTKKLSTISRYIEGNNPVRAYELADSALMYARKAGNNFWTGVAIDRIGGCLCTIGKYDEAIKKLREGIKLADAINSKPLAINMYNTIANSYMGLKQNDKAYENFLKANEIAKSSPGSEEMVAVTNIGMANMLLEKKETKRAIEYLTQGQEYFHKTGNPINEGHCLTTIGQACFNDSNFVDAEKNFLKAIALFREANEEYGISQLLQCLSDIEKRKGNYKKAVEYSEESLQMNLKRNAWDNIKTVALRISVLKEQLGQHQEALRYHKLYTQFNDSVINTERNKALAESESKYENEKKEQQLQLKNAELEKSELKVSQRNNLIYVFVGAILVFVILLFFVFSQYKEKKKANVLLVNKNDEIEKQKSLIEEKNKDITDSINYSRHIQRAILPSNKYIKFHLPESFIIYKPKDIVSGDFYLVEEVVGLVYIAVVDCTGHGVPGAMLSVFANATIKNTIATNAFRDNPAAILSDLCFQFKSNLLSDNSNMSINDGVDMSICILDKKQKKIYFSGARNALIAVSKGELKEYKADRWGISGTNSGEQLFFTNYEIDYNIGDRFYLSTDGYYDQFGGPEGKKLKFKMMKEMIFKVHSLKLDEQADKLNQEFMNWKGKLEQLDDVTVIGFGV